VTIRGGSFLLIGLLALSACTVPAAPRVQSANIRIAPLASVAAPSARSDALRTYYTRIEDRLVSRGLLRVDGGGPDTPFTDTQLARNFVRIALFDEYVSDGGILRARATASNLSRWSGPVRMSVEFGDTIPADQRLSDRIEVAKYANRLARVTGHPIAMSNANPNFYVMFLNEGDRLGSEARLRQLVPGIAPSSMRAILDLPSNQLCIVVAFSEAGKSTYSKAIAVIRGEHPDLLRKSCIHEELAQGLGLPNDSPAARPSIFNDDEEFGLLTTHDEMLLRMLYDPRLNNGMDAVEAAPIVRQIATELTMGSAS
tara:strand:+ start:3696 stop:4634 length:939 start_codon:yes stop_codon:yes gene_type:complete